MLLVALVYWPTLDNGYVSDDQDYVINNRAIQSLQGLRDIWFKLGTVQQYYPVVFTTFWAEFQSWGLEPRGYHVVNMLLHGLSAVLMWRLLERLDVAGAWLAGAIFAVHPVEVESVAWVSERKNVLSCALALGSLLSYLRYSPLEARTLADDSPARRSPGSYYALSLVLYVAALLAKSVTASVPAVLLVIVWWKRGRLSRRDAAPLVPFFAVGLALSYLTIWMEKNYVGAQGQHWDLSVVDRLLIAGRAAWFYAAKLAWPYPLMFFYPRWTIDATADWQYLYPLAAVALLIGLWLARKRIGRGPLAAVLIFGGVLTPALGFFDVFPFKFSFVADHYQYHAGTAMIALAAAGMTFAWKFRPRPWWIAPCAATALLLPLALIARQKTWVYADNVTLHQDVLAHDPQSWAALNNVGSCLLNQGDYEQAMSYFRQAIRLIPRDAMPRVNLGLALLKQRQFDEAAAELRRALECSETPQEQAAAWRLLGTTQSEQSHYDDALESYGKAIALQPTSAAYVNRGRVHVNRGDTAAAIADFDKALALQPETTEALLLRATLLAQGGKFDRALADLQSVRASVGDNPELLAQLAAVYQGAHRWEEAIAIYNQLLASHPGSAAAFRGRGDSYLGWGKQRQAIADYEAAIRLEPENREALNNLAWILATSPDGQLRDGKRAVDLAKTACAVTLYNRADILSTLAAAYAEIGDFEQAIGFSQRAVDIANEQLQGELLRQLEAYRARRPWREALPEDAAKARAAGRGSLRRSPLPARDSRTSSGLSAFDGLVEMT